jgi:hypothetical protein
MTVRKTDIHWRYKIPTEITIQTDSREKNPILFPSTVFITHPELTFKQIPIQVKTEKTALKYGDYCLKEYPDLCVFERKASQLEIYKNLNESHDRIRQAKAFRRLATSCKFPYLLIEASPAELLTDNAKIKNPEVIAHRLGLALAKYNLRALFVPWKSRNPNVRRKVGTLMIHIMLGCVLQETFNVPPVLLEEK